jgi:hypothetical protein
MFFKSLTLAFCLCYSCSFALTSDSAAAKTPLSAKNRIATGIGLLAIEYIGGPLLAQHVWWQDGFRWGNPLDYIGEGEPYHEDDMWHIAACHMFTEYHYQVLSRCFEYRHSVALAGALTFVTWTGIESLDALDIKGKWGFSLNDELANCLGIGFWVFKHYYPDVPVDIRVGFKSWSYAVGYIRNALVALDDYNAYAAQHAGNYTRLKVETIYRYNDWYGGLALSKKDDELKDLWGITGGWDGLRYLNKRTHGWWNKPVAYVSRFASVSLAWTFWIN